MRAGCTNYSIKLNNVRRLDRKKIVNFKIAKSAIHSVSEADTRRSFMANAAGQDLNSNSGRRKQSLDFRARIRFIVNGYETATKADYLSMIAHELAKD